MCLDPQQPPDLDTAGSQACSLRLPLRPPRVSLFKLHLLALVLSMYLLRLIFTQLLAPPTFSYFIIIFFIYCPLSSSRMELKTGRDFCL